MNANMMILYLRCTSLLMFTELFGMMDMNIREFPSSTFRTEKESYVVN